MPPKKQDKKAPAGGNEEDLSDLDSLPHIKSMTVTILYHFYQDNKEQVVQAINEQLTEEQLPEDQKHIKSITRQEIMELAQAKIDEQNAAAEGEGEPMQVDSKLLAELFTEKMVEFGLPLRRELKQNQAEAKDENQEEQENKEPKTDIVFNLIDYPRTQQEFDDFTKLRNPLNKVIAIKELKPKDFDKMLEEQNKPKPEPVEGEENEQPPAEGEDQEKPVLLQNEERDEVMNFLRMYDYK